MRLQAFEAALALDPTNSSLASKVGRSLVATHDFGPAIDYYETALARDKARGVDNSEMRSDLTMLYVKLRKFAEVRGAGRGWGRAPPCPPHPFTPAVALLVGFVYRGGGVWGEEGCAC
jgi:hypothetical protein